MKFLLKHIERSSNLGRKSKTLLQVGTDILLALSCFPLAFLLVNESIYLVTDPVIFLGICISVTSGMIAFTYFGLYQLLVRFITGNVLRIIAIGVLVSCSVLTLFIVSTSANIVFNVVVIYAILLFLSVGGSRFLVRRLLRNQLHGLKKQAVIYGAGEAGRELQNLLFHNQEIQPVAFIDDNPAIQDLTIGGSRVYSPVSFAKVKEKYGVSLVLLALPTVNRRRHREIITKFQEYNIEIKATPPLSKILIGQATLSELQPITSEMLLSRDAIRPDIILMRQNILNMNVMITGAGGSIGAELCRQILCQGPAKIVLFELSELALYQINEELVQAQKQTNHVCAIVPILGSVQDQKLVENTVKKFSVNSIYHAAAYKHVPLVEDNIIEGVRNNVFGTLNVAQTAIKLDVESFTLISTDKAVRPTNIMGASKRIAELICQAHAQEAVKTKFSMVRFGNVLGSSGSVIPHFQKQIEMGGPVTVTHPEITRYFMTIPEAAQLVLQASALSEGGDVFMLDMGEPVKIAELAAEMIRLAGYKPYYLDDKNQNLQKIGCIPISFTGLRKGEKLYEELLIGDGSQTTKHPRIIKAKEVSLPMGEINFQLARLKDACDAHETETVFNILQELPLEFYPSDKKLSDINSYTANSKHISNDGGV